MIFHSFWDEMCGEMWYAPDMEKNHLYNLMHQLTQESKSLWRITNNYTGEALSDDEKSFWQKLAQDKESTITTLKGLIKKALA